MSDNLIGACIVGQSGGPTSVINASIYGAIKTALDAPEITKVYGAEGGITGILNDRLYDMDHEDAEELELLMQTPAAALGSCRYKMASPEEDDTDYRRVLEVFKKYNVRYFFYNGGNDSMDTCNKISRYMAKSGWECRILGIPKTIDNDLYGTDHCPGFASAAKYIATSTAEIYKDLNVYERGSIIVIETMGRNAGWLAASSSLAGVIGCAPDLIYLPEADFDMDRFIGDVTSIYNKRNKCIVVVSEGIHYSDGTFVAHGMADSSDKFGHIQLGGLADILAAVLAKTTTAKVRGIEFSLLQRCGAHTASKTDIDEAFLAGSDAVNLAISGVSGQMVGFERHYEDGRYVCQTITVPLEKVANYESKVPADWITPEQNYVTQEFIDYALPLISGEPVLHTYHGLPRYAKLKKIIAGK